MLEIVKNGHTLVAAYTRAPAAGGRRGLELKKTPVHVAADGIGVSVFTPTTLRTAEAEDAFNGHAADVAVVAAYGLLLPITILKAPRLGCWMQSAERLSARVYPTERRGSSSRTFNDRSLPTPCAFASSQRARPFRGDKPPAIMYNQSSYRDSRQSRWPASILKRLGSEVYILSTRCDR
jgi:hypothetical protein